MLFYLFTSKFWFNDKRWFKWHYLLILNYRIYLFLPFLDMDVGKIDCMKQMGVTESFMVKRQVLVSAAEAAEMILRVDDIIKAAPRRREQDRSHC